MRVVQTQRSGQLRNAVTVLVSHLGEQETCAPDYRKGVSPDVITFHDSVTHVIAHRLCEPERELKPPLLLASYVPKYEHTAARLEQGDHQAFTDFVAGPAGPRSEGRFETDSGNPGHVPPLGAIQQVTNMLP
jgi:hypothetical protein